MSLLLNILSRSSQSTKLSSLCFVASSHQLSILHMASGPITSWEIDGETVETVSDFVFLGSKIPADGDCSHEIKRRLLLGRKLEIPRDYFMQRWAQ